MTRKLAIKLSLLSSIIYIALTILYFTSIISKINHSDSPSAGAGLGLLLAFLIPHYFMLLIAVIFNIFISLIKIHKKLFNNYKYYIVYHSWCVRDLYWIFLYYFYYFPIIFLIIAYNK